MKKFLLSALTVVLLIACQQEEAFVEVQEQQSFVAVEKKPYTTKVSTSDVMYLAGKFNAGQAQTKEPREIASVSTITDEAGEPLIYVVNYAHNQGFVLVSATKNYHPILAYNTEGNFYLSKEQPSTLTAWVEQMKENIDYANHLPSDSTFKYRTAWGKFEKDKSFNPQVMTRSVTNSVLDSYVMPMVSQWIQDGVEYHSLEEAAAFLPSDVYARFLANAENSIFPLYDYMNYTFVVVNDVSTTETEKIVFLPKWSQVNGYNAFLPVLENGLLPPTGCTAIAMAQVIRHFGKAKIKYPWDEMPYETGLVEANSVTALFVRDVTESIDPFYTDSATYASLENAQISLVENFGYNDAYIIDHSLAITMQEINKKQPVIMQGYNTSGHVWVASGYDRLYGHREYNLWVPVNNAEITEPYSVIDTYSDGYFDYIDIYIHWGWGGINDGYYLDSNIAVGEKTYNRNRKDIVNIYPVDYQ